jgi:hypothetical protein
LEEQQFADGLIERATAGAVLESMALDQLVDVAARVVNVPP